MHCQTLQVLLTELHQHPKLGNLGIQSTFKIEALIWVSFWRALNSQPFSWTASSNIRHQSKNVVIWNTKRVSNSCMNYIVHVSSTMWRIKNRPSNFVSCSDNTLRLLVLVTNKLYRGLQVTTSSFSIRGHVPKGCFEREVYFEGPNYIWRALKTSILNTAFNRCPRELPHSLRHHHHRMWYSGYHY